MFFKQILCIVILLFALNSFAKPVDTWDYNKLKESLWLDGLSQPWSLTFINRSHALFTEKSGQLWQVIDNKRMAEPVAGIPAINDSGQGGMLAVAVDPNYKNNGWVYIAYSDPLDGAGLFGKAMTQIERGQIKENTWVNSEIIFASKEEHYSGSGQHFGSRIVFDQQGHLYFSVGDRGDKDGSQSLSTPNGKIHRINTDGSIPDSNPFKDKSYPSIFSYGNRNPQGLAVHPVTGAVWSSEHGPRGGDEINLIQSGVNYGWPVISYGINYIGTELTPFVRKEGMVQPNYYWRPSIAVSNIAFYQGDVFPKWQNKLLVSSLKYQQLSLLDIEDNRVMHEEVIYQGSGRIRDVAVGFDGNIYLVLNGPDRIMRLSK